MIDFNKGFAMVCRVNQAEETNPGPIQQAPPPTHADRVSERHLIRLRYLNLAGAPKPLQALLDGVEAELLAAGGDQDDIRMLRQQALIEREQ